MSVNEYQAVLKFILLLSIINIMSITMVGKKNSLKDTFSHFGKYFQSLWKICYVY